MIKRLLAALLAFFALSAFAADANTASQAELEAIKGIGPAIATKIVDGRKDGAYKDWPDLVARVKGIGDKNAAKLSAGGLTVNGAAMSGAPAATPAAAKTAAPAAVPTPAANAKPTAATTAAAPASSAKELKKAAAAQARAEKASAAAQAKADKAAAAAQKKAEKAAAKASAASAAKK